MGIIIDKLNLENLFDYLDENSDQYKEYKRKIDEQDGVRDKRPRKYVLKSVYPDMETRNKVMQYLYESNRI